MILNQYRNYCSAEIENIAKAKISQFQKILFRFIVLFSHIFSSILPCWGIASINHDGNLELLQLEIVLEFQTLQT
jgi:hypothetical protein